MDELGHRAESVQSLMANFVMELRGSVRVLIFSPMLILGTEFLPVNCWGSVHWLTNAGEALPRILGCIMLLSSFQ